MMGTLDTMTMNWDHVAEAAVAGHDALAAGRMATALSQFNDKESG